jgi:hypothetical protein
VATTYIPVHGFSDIVEETDIQEFFASMLYWYFADVFCESQNHPGQRSTAILDEARET